MPDDIINEIRSHRVAYSERFNDDLDAIVNDLRDQATRSGWKVVSLPPRKIEDVESHQTSKSDLFAANQDAIVTKTG